MKAPHPKSRAAISTSPQGGGETALLALSRLCEGAKQTTAESEHTPHLPLAGRSTRREPRRVGGLSA